MDAAVELFGRHVLLQVRIARRGAARAVRSPPLPDSIAHSLMPLHCIIHARSLIR
jgi:hypothetical protein